MIRRCLSSSLLILTLAGSAIAAPTISDIKPGGGGDYLNLAAWEAAKDGAVAIGDGQWARCFTGGSLGACTIADWDNVGHTSSNAYIKIYTELGAERHLGRLNTGAYMDNAGVVLSIQEPFCRIIGLRIQNTAASDIVNITSGNEHGLHFEDNYVVYAIAGTGGQLGYEVMSFSLGYTPTPNTTSDWVYVINNGLMARNAAAYPGGYLGDALQITYVANMTNTIVIYNNIMRSIWNTVETIDAKDAVAGAGMTILCRNNVCHGEPVRTGVNPLMYFTGDSTNNHVIEYNASRDASAYTWDQTHSITGFSNNSGQDIMHWSTNWTLVSTSRFINAGVDLALVPEDFRGTNRNEGGLGTDMTWMEWPETPLPASAHPIYHLMF